MSNSTVNAAARKIARALEHDRTYSISEIVVGPAKGVTKLAEVLEAGESLQVLTLKRNRKSGIIEVQSRYIPHPKPLRWEELRKVYLQILLDGRTHSASGFMARIQEITGNSYGSLGTIYGHMNKLLRERDSLVEPVPSSNRAWDLRIKPEALAKLDAKIDEEVGVVVKAKDRDLSKRTVTATFAKHKGEDKDFVLTRKKELPYEYAWRVALFCRERKTGETGIDQQHGFAATQESADTTVGFARAELHRKHKDCCEVLDEAAQIVRTDVPVGQGVGSSVRAKTVAGYQAKWEDKMAKKQTAKVVTAEPVRQMEKFLSKTIDAEARLEKEVARLKAENDELRIVNKGLRRDWQKLSDVQTKAEAEIERLKQEFNDAETVIAAFNRKIDALEAENARLKGQVSADTTDYNDLIPIDVVLQIVGFARQYVYRLIKAGRFPEAVRLMHNSNQKVIAMWSRKAVEAWVKERK